jgi:hypothetical protein
MEASFSLVCNNKKVIDFYKNHPNLDFESMNLIFISIMENLTQDMNSSLNNNIATQLLTNIQGLQTQINFVSENVIKLQSDTILNFSAKFSEFKKEYIEDLKMILTNNSVNTIDRLTPLIKDYNSTLIDKTQLMLNDVVPKNNDNLTKQLKEIMTTFHSSISEETNQLLKTTINNDSLSDFINKMENKFLNTQTNTQQLLNAIITSTEHRLDSRINEIKTSTEQHIQDIKHLSSSNQSSQSLLQNNVYELLKKMEISSVKGKCSENILFNILQSLYSTAQIDIVGEQKETGDFMLMRKNKPTILIENKNWNKNVIQDEVKKFIRDVETQNCCGLFLSQNFGIANKENFEINIHNGHILLYVHEVNNDAEKIKIAIDIIDNFKLKLDEIVVCNGDGYNIDKEVLDEINKEYQLFATQKLLQIKMVKDFSSKMVKQLEDLNFPCLEHFLSTKYAFSSSKYICEFCDYVAKNQSAMSAHKRGCKTKNVNTSENNFNSNILNMSNKTENNNSELTINQNIQSSTLNVVEQNNVLTKEKQTKKSVKK